MSASALREIFLRQDLAFLDRGLIEGINAEHAARDDGFKHEVHEQRAERTLTELLEAEAGHRPAVARQRVDGGTRFGIDETADAAARKRRESGPVRERGRNLRPLARRLDG